MFLLAEDIDTLPGNLNFSVLSDSQTQLFVQWTPSTATPTTDPLLILYEVMFAAHGSPLQFSGMLESYRREYQIKDLKPGTSYNVTVLAHSVWATSNGVWSLASTYGNGIVNPLHPLTNSELSFYKQFQSEQLVVCQSFSLVTQVSKFHGRSWRPHPLNSPSLPTFFLIRTIKAQMHR